MSLVEQGRLVTSEDLDDGELSPHTRVGHEIIPGDPASFVYLVSKEHNGKVQHIRKEFPAGGWQITFEEGKIHLIFGMIFPKSEKFPPLEKWIEEWTDDMWCRLGETICDEYPRYFGSLRKQLQETPPNRRETDSKLNSCLESIRFLPSSIFVLTAVEKLVERDALASSKGVAASPASPFDPMKELEPDSPW